MSNRFYTSEGIDIMKKNGGCTDFFTVYRYRKGETLLNPRSGVSAVLFLLEGSVSVQWLDRPSSVIHSGSMSFFQKGSCISGVALDDVVLVSCSLQGDIMRQMSDVLSLSKLAPTDGGGSC